MHRLIQYNARLINELHGRLHDEYKKQPLGPAHRRACEEFHAHYDRLAFPGGYESGIQKIQQGDLTAIEAALSFLEVRPYFFRSQYMRTKLMRLVGRADLTENQKQRFTKIKEEKKKQPNKAVHSTLTRVTSPAVASLLGRSGATGERD